MEERVRKLSPLALAGLLFLNVGYYYDLVMVPAYSMYYEYYAQYPEFLVNFGSTGPQLFLFLGTLICTFLLTKLSKKTILVASFGLFTFCGCTIGMTDNFYYFLAMRSLLGLGAGGLLPVAIALITEVYRDEPGKVSLLTGVYNGVGSCAGAVLTLIAGFLCLGAWQDVFKCYWVSIPILIMLVAFVPKTPPETKAAVGAAESDEGWSKGPLIATAMGPFIMSVFYVTMVVFLSAYVEETGLGGPDLTGVYSSVMTVGSAIGGFTFPVVYKLLGRKTPWAIYGATAVGYLLLFITGNYIVTGIGTTLAGWGYTAAISYYMVYVAKVVPAYLEARSITIAGATLALGAFASSYIYTGLLTITGMSPGYMLPYMGFFALAGTALSVAVVLATRRKPA